MGSVPELAGRAALAGRYVIHHDGRECGEERWRLATVPEGAVLTGEQVIESPHPFPNRHEYRATVSAHGRVTGLEVLWTVGTRVLRATQANWMAWCAPLRGGAHRLHQLSRVLRQDSISASHGR